MLLQSNPAALKLAPPPVQNIPEIQEPKLQEIEISKAPAEAPTSEAKPSSIPELDALNSINISDAGATHIPMMADTQMIGSKQMLSKDEFWAMFKGMFTMGGVVIAMRGPKLESIAIQPNEEAAAREASNAIYDTCAEISWLRFILEPENVYVKRALVIGVFFYGKAEMIKAEIQLLNMKAEQPMQEVKPERPNAEMKESKPKKGEWTGGTVEL